MRLGSGLNWEDPFPHRLLLFQQVHDLGVLFDNLVGSLLKAECFNVGDEACEQGDTRLDPGQNVGPGK